MDLKTKVGIAVVAVVMLVVTVDWMWSGYRIRKLERAVAAATAEAEAKTQAADEMEKRSAVYQAKAEYLEQMLAEVGEVARRQDEGIEKAKNSTAARRADAARAGSVRSVPATADELCAKLAEVGHECR